MARHGRGSGGVVWVGADGADGVEARREEEGIFASKGQPAGSLTRCCHGGVVFVVGNQLEDQSRVPRMIEMTRNFGQRYATIETTTTIRRIRTIRAPDFRWLSYGSLSALCVGVGGWFA